MIGFDLLVTRRKLLFYKLAKNDPDIIHRFGFYETWFERVLGPDRLHVYEAHRPTGEVDPRPDPRGFDGLVISGSPSSLCRREDWMDEAAGMVRRAAEAGVPVLGVCFGHQLIAHAWGSAVTENPRGWEIGTCQVTLTDAGARDPLFDGLPRALTVNETHQDHVADLRPEIVRLAGNDQTPTQAIAIGEHVRGVQFHPEVNGQIVRAYIEKRRHILEEDVALRGRPEHDRPAARFETAIDTPEGERVLRNFDHHFVQKA